MIVLKFYFKKIIILFITHPHEIFCHTVMYALWLFPVFLKAVWQVLDSYSDTYSAIRKINGYNAKPERVL